MSFTYVSQDQDAWAPFGEGRGTIFDSSFVVGRPFGFLSVLYYRNDTLTLYPEARSVSGIPLQSGSPLIDDITYYQSNPDVFRSGLSAAEHYARFGWKEGRATGSLFDAAYYLRQNPDVRAAETDPVRHYLEHGWKEGRNPSPLFDTAYYLSGNPDVAAAGVNPLEHFLLHGRFEGRSPNPFFDPGLYLKQAPDVAAWGGSPLDHALSSYSWERPATSRQFITKVYLAQNPDVAAAGVNPLAHYLEFGRQEGRALSSGTPATVTGTLHASTTEDSAGTVSGLVTVRDPDPLESGFDATFGKDLAYIPDSSWQVSNGFPTEPSITLILEADGFWTFSPYDGRFQHLRAGQTEEVTFLLRTVGQDEVTLSITVIGENDPAWFSGSFGALLDARDGLRAYGQIFAYDVDDEENGLQAGTLAGTYGTLTLAGSGRWEYLFTGNAELGIAPLSPHPALTDVVTVRSLDGTAQPITIAIQAFDAVL